MVNAPADAGYHGISDMTPGTDFLEFDNCFECSQDHIFMAARCGNSSGAKTGWIDDWAVRQVDIYKAVAKGDMIFTRVAAGPLFPGNEAFKAAHGNNRVFFKGHSWGINGGDTACWAGKFVDCNTTVDFQALSWCKAFCGARWNGTQMNLTTFNKFSGFNNPPLFGGCCDCFTSSGGDVGTLNCVVAPPPGPGPGPPPPGPGPGPGPGPPPPPGPCGPADGCPNDEDGVFQLLMVVCPGGIRVTRWIKTSGGEKASAYRSLTKKIYWVDGAANCWKLVGVTGPMKWKQIKNKPSGSKANEFSGRVTEFGTQNSQGECVGQTC